MNNTTERKYMQKKSSEQEALETKRIGRMLQAARERAGLSQGDMVDYAGVSKNHVSSIERGLSKTSVPVLLGYCRRLNTTPNEILGFTETSIIPELRARLQQMNEEQQQRVLDLIHISRI